MESFLWKTEQEGVAVVKPGGDETVDQNGSCVRCERGAEAVDVAEMEVS